VDAGETPELFRAQHANQTMIQYSASAFLQPGYAPLHMQMLGQHQGKSLQELERMPLRLTGHLLTKWQPTCQSRPWPACSSFGGHMQVRIKRGLLDQCEHVVTQHPWSCAGQAFSTCSAAANVHQQTEVRLTAYRSIC
jgi:hypothetical protein